MARKKRKKKEEAAPEVEVNMVFPTEEVVETETDAVEDTHVQEKVEVFTKIVKGAKLVEKKLHTEDGVLIRYGNPTLAAKIAAWHGYRSVKDGEFYIIVQ